MKCLRFLSLLLCLPLLLAACTLGPDRPAPSSAATATTVSVTKSLGSFEPIVGTPYLSAPIAAQAPERGGFSLSSSSYSSDEAANYVYLDRRDETFVQLLPTNDQRVLFRRGFSTPEDEQAPVAWFLYGVVAADQNGDERLDWDDGVTLAASDVSGVGYTVLITNVTDLYGATLRDPQTLLVIYRREGNKQLARIDLPGRRVLVTTALPPLGTDVR